MWLCSSVLCIDSNVQVIFIFWTFSILFYANLTIVLQLQRGTKVKNKTKQRNRDLPARKRYTSRILLMYHICRQHPGLVLCVRIPFWPRVFLSFLLFFFLFSFFFVIFDWRLDNRIYWLRYLVLTLWSCFISFAEPFSQYTIKLAAYTSVGKGPFATRNYSTDEGGI